MLEKDGTQISDPQGVLNEIENFYSTLYSPLKVSNDTLHGIHIDIPKLNETESQALEGYITQKEALHAIKSMKNNKTPGIDGLPCEFYKFFWPKIGDHVFACYQAVFRQGNLSQEQRRAIITLLPKKDKSREFLKNWRPISLLNTDYKILTKTIAFRIQKLLPDIIGPEPTGCIKGRYIGENIRIIEY